MSAALVVVRPHGPTPSALADWRALAVRHLVQILRRPATLIGVLCTPMVFAVLFFAVFGRFIPASGLGYAQYLLPAVLIQATLSNGISAAVAAAEDVGTGFLRRLRALPIARSAPLLGWLAARVLVALVSLLLLVSVGYGLGFRFLGGPPATVGFVLCTILLALTVCSGYLALGLSIQKLPLLDAVCNLVYFPMLLLSNAFTPTGSYPGWLRPVIAQLPVSRIADLLRALSVPATPPVSTVLIGLAWLLGPLVLFVWLGARRFGRQA
ncbi:ABC transporter permease [Sciscionella marina]|uniref:ABC transporter permease n=1 Tax=Sciscionella marina TaxID=508770 RepID=UPI000382D05C|nr:ABC transporter permease [Sciscionella marina]